MVLRTCGVCGLTAKTEEDLELFKKNPVYRHGRMNLCKECNNNLNRKGGKYGKVKALATARWQLENKNKKIRFRDKRIYLNEPVRVNICSSCGKKYPQELNRQTHLHHIIYSSKNPLSFTVELCNSCHMTLHNELVKLIKRTCVDCGKTLSRGLRAIRCIPCQEKYRKDYQKKNRERRKEKVMIIDERGTEA